MCYFKLINISAHACMNVRLYTHLHAHADRYNALAYIDII